MPHASFYTHPATPWDGASIQAFSFVDRSVLLFLEKLRLAAKDIIKLPEFHYTSSEEKERRRLKKILCDERKPNLFVIQDPDQQHHKEPITFNDARQQTGEDRTTIATIREVLTDIRHHRTSGTSASTTESLQRSTTPELYTWDIHTIAAVGRAVRRRPHRRDDSPPTGVILRRDRVQFCCTSDA